MSIVQGIIRNGLKISFVVGVCLISAGSRAGAAGGHVGVADRHAEVPADQLPDRIRQYEADIEGLKKVYLFKDSPEDYERMRRYNQAALASLQELPFGGLTTSDQLDYLLLQRYIRHALQELEQSEKLYEQVRFAIPFAQRIMDIQV